MPKGILEKSIGDHAEQEGETKKENGGQCRQGMSNMFSCQDQYWPVPQVERIRNITDEDERLSSKQCACSPSRRPHSASDDRCGAQDGNERSKTRKRGICSVHKGAREYCA